MNHQKHLVLFISVFTLTLSLFHAKAETVGIDADGRRGQDGSQAPGYNHNPGTGHGVGKSGSDATNSTAGTNAGNIELFLTDKPQIDSAQKAQITLRTLINGQSQPDRSLIITEPGARIYLSARGGDGGHGGIGGDGEGGQNGYKGNNAAISPFNQNTGTPGSDGTSGWPGGSNGIGTPGSNGGNGGEITVHLSTEDSYLSLLLSAEVSGGSGGNRGRDGRVGTGGNGGAGGDSLDWETTESYQEMETYYVDVPYQEQETYYVGVDYQTTETYSDSVPYTDTESYSEPYQELESNGNGSYKTVTRYRSGTRSVTRYRSETKTRTVTKTRQEPRERTVTKYRSEARQRLVTRYRQVPHHLSGGNTGRRGTDGTYRAGNTQAGLRGSDGTFKILVTDKSGVISSYQSSSNIRLLSYDYFDENGDGIIEPGEKVFIKNITVKNTGEMPGPSAKSNAIVFLRNSAWVLADPVTLSIPEIKSGESYTFQTDLSFRVRNFPGSQNSERWQAQDEIIPDNEVTRIRYSYSDLHLPKTFTITYPVEITTFEIPSVVGVGEEVPVTYKIRNISNQAVGANSFSNRALTVSVKGSGEGENAQSELNFGENAGALSQGIISNFANLAPQETMVVHGTLNVSQSANPYTTIELNSSLGFDRFQPIKEQENHITLQKHSITVKVGLLYRHKPEAKVLLVTNARTSRSEYLAWQEFLKKLNLGFDVWDLGYYKSLSFLNSLNSVNDSKSTLAKDFEGKTIIVLNSDTGSGTKAEAFIQSKEFLQITQNNKIRFYVVGGDDENTLTNLLRGDRPSVSHGSLPELVDALKNDTACTQTHCFEIKGHRYLIGTDDTAQSVLAEVEKNIRECLPDDRFCISFSAAESVQKGLFTDNVSFGKISINGLSGLAPRSQAHGRAVFIPLGSDEVQSTSFIHGEENFRGLLLSLDLDSKLNIIETLGVGQNADYKRIITDNLMLEAITSLDYILNSNLSETPQALPANIARMISAESFDSIKLGAGVGLFLKVFSENNSSSKIAKSLFKLYSSGASKEQNELQKQLEKRLELRAKYLVHITPVENVRHMLSYPGLYRAKSTEYMLAPGNYLELGQ